MLSACTETLNLAVPLLTSMEILIMLFDVPLLIYVGLRTPGVPQSRNSGSPAHSLTECARRNTQFGPIPHPDRSRSAGGVVIFRWVVCLLCTPSREVHKKTYCIGPELCSILRPNVSMSRKLWVGFLCCFESVHREVTPERPLLAAPQGNLRGQGARARLVGEHPHHPRPPLYLFEQMLQHVRRA